MDANTLAHYGVLGMKWGVRRYQNRDGTLTTAGEKRYRVKKEDPVHAERESRKRDVQNRQILSDAELKKKVERLKLERELRSLTSEEITPGKKYAEDILKSIGTKVLVGAGAGVLAYSAKVAMTKSFDIKEAASYIAPNPNKKK